MSSKLAYLCVHVYFENTPIGSTFVRRYIVSVYRSCFVPLVFHDHLRSRSGYAGKLLR